RLRAVAASYITNKDDLAAPEKAQATFRLVLTRTTGSINDDIGPDEIAFLPNVRSYGSQIPPEFVEAASLYNMDPRGKWDVSLSRKGVTVAPTIFVERGDWIK